MVDGETLKIEGFGTLRYKQLSDAELLTAFETFIAECHRSPKNRGKGYLRNVIRQEILFRLKKKAS